MTHKRHHILRLLMERWKKVSDISQPPISTTAAAVAQLPHCCSWRPTAPCCLGVTARAQSPPSLGVLETYYYLSDAPPAMPHRGGGGLPAWVR
ncbi:hypothetical protein E2C01_074999 [Portunus trituberculatus]|uniref:Uncharacterized protein n=1 Tax=Portunus trituberculatus TaxID=210409 RepID=A0A5B7I7B4_PORTR|nr:hypothetical protein [Portunus trituberculatus]